MFEVPSDPAALVAVIESTHREESMLVARRLAAVAALLRHRVATADGADREYAEIDGFEQTAAEVAAVMNLSAMGASFLVSHAEALDTRLPRWRRCWPRGERIGARCVWSSPAPIWSPTRR